MDRHESLHRFHQYLQRRFPERRTPQDYLSDLRQFMAVCGKAWREVTMQDIDAFVDQQRQTGLKPTTVNRRVAALKTFFDFLAEETGDLSWPNPVRFKRHAGKRPRRLPRDLSDETVECVWRQVTDARDRAWFVLMWRAGLRVSEVIGLRLEDLLCAPQAEQPARLRVCGKGRKERIVLLSADAYAVLHTWLQVRSRTDASVIFLNERGAPLSVSGIEWLLHRYGQQAGVAVTPHQLRHTYARQLTEAEMPITSLSKLLGHSQVTTTQIYTAGADPQLSQAYQQAIQRLADTPQPSSPSPTAALSPPAHTRHVAVPPPPPLPDFEAWALDLPPAIRQASLAYVRRQAATWKPGGRRMRAQGMLSELKRFWAWQIARRPLASPLELRLSDLQDFQSACKAQGKQNTSINRRLDYVMGILRQLADQGQPVDGSLFRLRSLPRPDSLPRHLSEPQSQRLEARLRTRLNDPDPRSLLETACLFVLAHGGLRSAECVDLQVQDVDLESRRLVVRQGKGQRDRVVYLSASACQAIHTYLCHQPLDPSSPLWVNPKGQPISQLWLRKRVAALGQSIQIPDLCPQRLRHTLATRLLNAGMDVTRIQKFLGHDQLSTTMIYARVLDTTVEADYRKAMQQIELRQMPLSDTPIPVADVIPFGVVNVQATLDNSV